MLSVKCINLYKIFVSGLGFFFYIYSSLKPVPPVDEVDEIDEIKVKNKKNAS